MLRSVIPLNRIVQPRFLILPVRLKYVNFRINPPGLVIGEEQREVKSRPIKLPARFCHDQSFLTLSDHIQQAFSFLDSKLTDRITVTKVVTTPDLTALHVYWLPASVDENIADVNVILKKNSHKVRQYLQECKVTGRIPPVIFKQHVESNNSVDVENKVKQIDASPETECPNYVVDKKPLKMKTDSKSFENLKQKFLDEAYMNEDIISIIPQKNSAKNCDDKDEEFSDLRSRYRDDICKVQHSFLMDKIRRKLCPKRNKNRVENTEELGHESTFKNRESLRRPSQLKEKLQLDAFHSMERGYQIAVEDKIKELKAISSNAAKYRKNAKKTKNSKTRRKRTATYEDL